MHITFTVTMIIASATGGGIFALSTLLCCSLSVKLSNYKYHMFGRLPTICKLWEIGVLVPHLPKRATYVRLSYTSYHLAMYSYSLSYMSYQWYVRFRVKWKIYWFYYDIYYFFFPFFSGNLIGTLAFVQMFHPATQ